MKAQRWTRRQKGTVKSDYKDKKWVLIQNEQEKLEREAKMVLYHQTRYAKRFRLQG